MSNADASDPAPPAWLRKGEILAGKYVIERVLGVGGMGIVVCATHAQLDQRVAIKLMLPELLPYRLLVDRFEQEARSAVRLRSEHVTRIHDVGRLDDGTPYIVMEYLEGKCLADILLEKGPFAPSRAVRYVLQACEAVAEAHALGIIHRDLKPANLFLTTRVHGGGLIKVLDFGIAKAATQAAAPNSGPISGVTPRTHATEVLGTPQYMSPEQIRSSRDVDARADVWSLGVILYELLTGVMPFDAEVPSDVAAMVLRDEPKPLRALRADVPKGLADVVHACLKKDVSARVQDVAELAEALAKFAPEGHEASRRIAAVHTGRTSIPNAEMESEFPPPPEVELEEGSDSKQQIISAPTIPAPPLTPTPVLSPPTTGGSSSASIDITPTDPLQRRGRPAPWIVAAAGIVAVGICGVWVATRKHDRSTEPTQHTQQTQSSAANAATTNAPVTNAPLALPLASLGTGAPPPAPSASESAALAATTGKKPIKPPIAGFAPIKPASSSAPPAGTAKPASDEDILGGRK